MFNDRSTATSSSSVAKFSSVTIAPSTARMNVFREIAECIAGCPAGRSVSLWLVMVFQRRDKYSVFGWIQIIILGELPAPRKMLHWAGAEKVGINAEARRTRRAQSFESPSGLHICRNQNEQISSSVRSDIFGPAILSEIVLRLAWSRGRDKMNARGAAILGQIFQRMFYICFCDLNQIFHVFN